MIKLLLAFLILGFSLSSFAQKIHFTDTTNIWRELHPQYNAPYPELLYYNTYSFIRHSTIDSVDYKLFNFGEEYLGVAPGGSFFIREDTILKKVFVRDLTGDSDLVLMDYNLNVGDTFTTPNNQFVVIAIDSTLINSVWYKVWSFSEEFPYEWGPYTINVIEGIGCIQDPSYMLWDLSGCVECTPPSMYCFSNNGITPPLIPPVSFLNNTTSCSTFPALHTNQLQPSHDKMTLYPNPATTSLTIQSTCQLTIQSTNQPINQIAITNLLGQTLYTQNYNTGQIQIDVSNLPTGMYFVKINGSEVRKFVKE